MARQNKIKVFKTKLTRRKQGVVAEGQIWLSFPPLATKSQAMKSAREKNKAFPPNIRKVAIARVEGGWTVMVGKP